MPENDRLRLTRGRFFVGAFERLSFRGAKRTRKTERLSEEGTCRYALSTFRIFSGEKSGMTGLRRIARIFCSSIDGGFYEIPHPVITGLVPVIYRSQHESAFNIARV